MGTISDKLTYLNETKSQIKSMINYGLETPLTNEPFRDYVSSIFKAFIESLNNPDTLWGNLPKITGSGTNISLNNTIEAPMRIELSPVELSQDATPTPSSPQDIHTISGSNTIKVEGRNLMNTNVLFQEMQDYSSTRIPTQVVVDNRNCIEFGNNWYDGANFYQIGYKENTSYTLRVMARVKDATITSGYNIYMRVRYTDNTVSGTSVSASGSTWQEIRVVTNASKTIKSIYFTYGSSTLWYIDEDSFNIIEGDTTTYEPYKGSDYSIDLRTYTNLFDEKTMIPGKTINTSGEIANYSTTGASEQYIKVEPNTQYTFNCSSSYTLRVNKYTSDKTHIERIEQASTSSFSFTTDNNCYYIRVSFYAGADVTQTLLDSLHFWVNKGATALSYTPYNDIEYCKIGNYEDKIFRTSGKNLIPTTTDKWEQGTIASATGENSSSTTRIRTIDYYPITPGNNYISIVNTGYKWLNIMYYDSSKTFITAQSTISSISGSQSALINVPNNTSYFRATIAKNDASATITASEISTIQPMINKGSTALDYEPYGSNEWYIKKNIGKVVLDGSEAGWNMTNSSNTGLNAFWFQKSVHPEMNISAVYDKLSNYFPYIKQSWKDVTSPCLCENTALDTTLLIFSGFSDITSVANWQTWLSTHNTEVYYVLATPTYTQITGTLAEQLEAVKKSKDGTTNISQVNNDLAFGLSVQAIEDLS